MTPHKKEKPKPRYFFDWLFGRKTTQVNQKLLEVSENFLKTWKEEAKDV